MKKLLVALFALLLAMPIAARAEEDPDALARDFIKNLQQLVKQDKRADIADLLEYPFHVDAEAKAADPEAFLQQYDSIFTPKVKACILAHKLSETESIKGYYMVGESCAWVGFSDNDKMRLQSIYTNM